MVQTERLNRQRQKNPGVNYSLVVIKALQLKGRFYFYRIIDKI
jgi:hypothetical protein